MLLFKYLAKITGPYKINFYWIREGNVNENRNTTDEAILLCNRKSSLEFTAESRFRAEMSIVDGQTNKTDGKNDVRNAK